MGHFTLLPAAGMPLGAPVAPEAPEPPADDALVEGVAEEFVAAWAATPPPRIRAPETDSAAPALWIARILLTSSTNRFRCCLTDASQTDGAGRSIGDAQEPVKKRG